MSTLRNIDWLSIALFATACAIDSCDSRSEMRCFNLLASVVCDDSSILMETFSPVWDESLSLPESTTVVLEKVENLIEIYTQYTLRELQYIR